MQTVEELERQLNALKKENESLKNQLKRYEQNGSAKLYYALNRKQNEMADLLNSNSLEGMELDDNKSKTFERVFKILEKSETVANSVKTLGEVAGVTGKEEEDIKKKPFNDRIAEERY